MNHPQWKLIHPRATHAMLGYVPEFLDLDDPRPAHEQIHHRFIGGWAPFKGYTMTANSLTYPGDPPRELIAETRLRDEVVRFYRGAWIVIVQPDGSFEASCID